MARGIWYRELAVQLRCLALRMPWPHSACCNINSRLSLALARVQITQVFIDQFVHHPLMYFPVFYCLKEVCRQGNVPLLATSPLSHGESCRVLEFAESHVAWPL